MAKYRYRETSNIDWNRINKIAEKYSVEELDRMIAAQIEESKRQQRKSKK